MGKGEDSSKVLLVNNFIESFRWSLVSPFLPVFYYTIVGSFTLLNLINYSTAIVASIFAIIWAKISDSYGRRKPFVLLSYATAIVTTFLLANIKSAYQLILLRLFGSLVGSAGGASFSALLAKSFKKNRGQVIGIYSSLGTLGSVIGNILSGYLYSIVGIRVALQYLAFTTIIPLILVLMIKEEPEERKPLNLKTIFKPPKIPREFIKYYLYNLFRNCREAFFGGIVSIYFLNYLGGTPEQWALIMSITTLLSLTAPFWGRLVDKHGVRFAYTYSAIGWVIISIGYCLAKDPVTFSIFFIMPVSIAYSIAYNKIIFDASDQSDRASFFSFLGLISSLFSMITGLIAGYIADTFTPYTLLEIYALLSIIGLIPLPKLLKTTEIT